jgi:hypothetical protein
MYRAAGGLDAVILMLRMAEPANARFAPTRHHSARRRAAPSNCAGCAAVVCGSQ